MIINHNITAMNTYRQLSINEKNMQTSMAHLSSGLRINSAADDAAGLAISEKMKGQMRGLEQASRNAQDGISMVQTAEGALSQTTDILQRMRELATQSSNDTNTSQDRDQIQKEMDQLTSEVNRIGNTTEFNTKKLLDGEAAHTDATNTTVTSGAIGNTINLVAAATSGTATGSGTIAATTNIHLATGANVTGATGAPALDDGSLGTTPLVIGSGNNELTLTVGGVQKTITLTQKTYDGTTTGQKSADLINDINSQISTAFGSAVATASLDPTTHELVLTTAATGTSSSISINGGNGAAALFGNNWNTTGITSNAGQAANNSLNVNVNGVQKTLTLTPNSTATQANLVSDLNTQLDAAFGAGNAVASITGNKLTITSSSTGSTSNVSIDGTSSAASALGVTTSTSTAGQDQNNQLSLNVDGTAISNINLGTGNTSTDVIAATIQTAISTAGKSASVSFNNGQLTIADNTAGSAGTISVTNNPAATSLGLTTATGMSEKNGQNAANGDLTLQIGANMGQTMSINISDMRSVALGISGASSGEAASVAGASFNTSATVTNGTDNNAVEYSLDVSSASKSTAAIQVLDNAINNVSSERAKLGAYENRLNYTINNLNTSDQNITTAQSGIADVDMAKEMMSQTKNSVLAQAAQAMLAQANQQPQQVLQLLR